MTSVAAFLVVVLLGTTSVLWIIAIRSLVRSLGNTTRIEGELVDFAHHTSHGRDMYTPRYRAVLPDGRTVTLTGSLAKSWQSPPVGTCVALRYKQNRDDIQLAEAGARSLVLPIVLLFVGAAVAVPAVIVIVGVVPYPSKPAGRLRAAVPHRPTRRFTRLAFEMRDPPSPTR
jgi:hypothetical protein